MNPFLAQAWSDLHEDASALRLVGARHAPVPLPSSMDVSGLAASSVAAASLALELFASWRTGVAPSGRLTLQPERIAAAFRSERLFRLNGAAPNAWGPLSGFWPAADGWIRTHANYPHHDARLRKLLGLSALAGPPDLAAAVSSWSALELEDAAADRGAIVAAVRSATQWAATEQAATLARLPLIDVRVLRTDASPRGPLGASTAPLSGVRVLDLTRVIAGPVATRTLALAGADVLRIDPSTMPEFEWQYLDTGAGKRSATLDLTRSRGLAALHELLARADVLVTGYRPGALDRFGLSVDELSHRYPQLVFGTVSAWGETGPWSGRRGFDSIVQAATGIADRHRSSGCTPGALPAQALDHSSGYFLAAAIASALRRLREHGVATHSAVSLARVGQELLATTATYEGEVPDLEPQTVEGAGSAGRVRTALPALAYTGAPRRFSRLGSGWATDAPTWL